jgi:hypothetical protein
MAFFSSLDNFALSVSFFIFFRSKQSKDSFSIIILYNKLSHILKFTYGIETPSSCISSSSPSGPKGEQAGFPMKNTLTGGFRLGGPDSTFLALKRLVISSTIML